MRFTMLNLNQASKSSRYPGSTMPPGLTPPGSCLAALAAEFEAPVSPKIGWKSSVFNVERSNLITGDSFRAFSVTTVTTAFSLSAECVQNIPVVQVRPSWSLSQNENRTRTLRIMNDYDNSPTVRTPSALLDLFFASAQLLCHLRYTIHLRTMKISPCCVKFQGDKSGRNHLHLPWNKCRSAKNHSVRPPPLDLDPGEEKRAKVRASHFKTWITSASQVASP